MVRKLVPLHELFDIVHGNKFDLNKMTKMRPSEAIAFVGRSGVRNGVVADVTRFRDVEPHAAGLITVALGGAALSSFVQPRAFYTAQNIDILKPKVPMTFEQKIYSCLCIEANSFRYSTFGREANRTLRYLLVPGLEDTPEWVNMAASRAVAELKNALSRLSDAS